MAALNDEPLAQIEPVLPPQFAQLTVPTELHGARLDAAVATLTGLSRAKAAQLAEADQVVVNGLPAGKSTRVRTGDELVVELPQPEPEGVVLTPSELPILFEDDDIVVVDKPVAMAAHSGPGWAGPTVIGALLANGHRVATSGPPERTGIVHRLDVGTTGAMVVAKTELAYVELKNAFRYRRVHKTYHALAQGHLDPLRGTIEAPIGRSRTKDFKMAVREDGKPAITHYDTVELMPGATLLEVGLETGRTHQIRVHMQAINHPLVGDPTYGGDPALARRIGLERQWLHAVALEFEHPRTMAQVRIECPYPDDLLQALEQMRV